MSDNDGDHAERRSQCKRAHVTHKHHRWISVEPQKTKARSSYSATENDQLTRTREICDIQILSKKGVPRQVGNSA